MKTKDADQTCPTQNPVFFQPDSASDRPNILYDQHAVLHIPDQNQPEPFPEYAEYPAQIPTLRIPSPLLQLSFDIRALPNKNRKAIFRTKGFL
ncbi:MAG: hypothetical protein J6F33_06065 [Acidaminococcaceae bacterium]|nr:hypothetical protein [Acidaminococcaceae bacterium]